MSVSIKEVASYAGVSISTVSRALNGIGSVSKKTREKILHAAEELGYVPNTNAKYLKISNTRNVALLVRGISNPFFSPIMRLIQRQISMRGYTLLVIAVDDGQDELEVALQMIQERKLCGILLLGGLYQHTQEEIERLGGVPCVFITFRADAGVAEKLYSSVIVDDTLEMQKGCEHLIHLNHRNIAFLAKSPMQPNTTGYRRMLGYRAALEKYNIPFDPSRIIDCEYRPREGYDAVRAILSRDKSVTAILAAADTIAIGAAKAALTMGLRIPEDISIVGFDGIEFAEYYHPSIDSFSQPATAMAQSAVDMLFSMMDGEEGKHQVFETTLIKRGSTAKNRK